MKKVLFILAFLAIGMIATAQTQTIYNQLKLATVNDGTVSDSLVLVQGTDKIIRKIPLSSISGSTEIPSLQEVTNNGNVTSHPIHAKEFRVDNVADSLAVLNNRFLTFGDVGNDYNGNWNKYMSVFDPQDYPEGFEIHNSVEAFNGGFNLYGNAQGGTSSIAMSLWDQPSGGDHYYSNQINSPNYIDSKVNINGTSSFNSGTRIVPESFSVYHDNTRRTSILANRDLDVSLGDNAMYLGAASNRILIQNSANKIRVVAPNSLELGSDGGNARVNIFNDETTEIVGSNIWLKSHPTASKAQLETGGLTDDRVFSFPDATGTLATQEWVTANSGGGTPTLQEVLTAGNTSTTGQVFSGGSDSTLYNQFIGTAVKTDIYPGTLVIGQAPTGNNYVTLQGASYGSSVSVKNTGGTASMTSGSSGSITIDNGGFSSGRQYVSLAKDRINYSVGGVSSPIVFPASLTFTGFNSWQLPDAQGTFGIVNTAAPASATSAGKFGEIRVTVAYIYVCIANNTWRRAALATW